MSINTRIPGSPAAVMSLADWLAKLRSEVDNSRAASEQAYNLCLYVWTGLSGNGFKDFSNDLTGACEEVSGRLFHAEDLIRAYAQQLQWRQDDMAVHREKAQAGHLEVKEWVINAPPTVMAPPPLIQAPGGTPAEDDPEWAAQQAAYVENQEMIALYNKLIPKVRATFDQLDTWIADTLVAMESAALDPPGIVDLAGVLADTTGELSANAFTDHAELLRSRISAAAEELARLRSGNPEVRSGAKPPRERALARAMKPGTPADELAKWGGRFDDLGKWAGRSGTVVGIGLAGYQIGSGESPSSVAVGVAAGVAGGVVAGLAISAATAGVVATAPAWVPVAAVAGVAIGAGLVSWGASAAYENLVPKVTRDQIDEGLKDAWNSAGEAIFG